MRRALGERIGLTEQQVQVSLSNGCSNGAWQAEQSCTVHYVCPKVSKHSRECTTCKDAVLMLQKGLLPSSQFALILLSSSWRKEDETQAEFILYFGL